MGNVPGTTFVTDSGQFYDNLYATGLPQGNTSMFRNAEQAWQVRRAKIIEIQFMFLVRGETGTWVVWQGDDDISATEFDNPDEVRNDDRICKPLAGGVIPQGELVNMTIRPSKGWIGSEEKVVLCVNPTAGICEFYMSIHTLFMIGGNL